MPTAHLPHQRNERNTMTTYLIEVQTMAGEWNRCKATMQWTGSEWVYPVFGTESEARAAAEKAWPDRFPEGSEKATFRIVSDIR